MCHVVPAKMLAAGLVFFATIAVTAAQPGQAGSFDRPDIFGIGNAAGDSYLFNPAGYDDLIFERITQAGAVSTRLGVGWPTLEPSPGQYQWAKLDDLIDLCDRYDVEPYVIIITTPGWARDQPQDTTLYAPLESHAQEFIDFCTALGTRYHGRVWHYEFWNEPNGYGWHYEDGFNHAGEYIPWLRRCYRAMKAVDPQIDVSVGGLDDADGNAPYYVSLLYQYRDAWYPGERLFDAIATHPYVKRSLPVKATLRSRLRAIRNLCVSNGEPDCELWVTEWGWALRDVPEVERVTRTREYLETLMEPEFHYVTAAQYLAIGDFDLDFAGFGLCDIPLRPRTVYGEFQRLHKGGDVACFSDVLFKPIGRGAMQCTWRTTLPCKGRLAYGTARDQYAWLSEEESAESTTHEIILRDLTPGAAYHLRPLASAGTHPSATGPDFRYIQPLHNAIYNAGFELGGLGGYAFGWEAMYGDAHQYDGDHIHPKRRRSGLHSAMMTMHGGLKRKLNATYMTRVTTRPGTEYTFHAYTYGESGQYQDGATTSDTYRRIGTDPTGGTDTAAPTVQWSAWLNDEEQWSLQHVTATAMGEVVTLFFHAESPFQNPEYYIAGIDDTGFIAVSQPAGAHFEIY